MMRHIFDQEPYQEVKSFLIGGGAMKKRADRGKSHAEPSSPLCPSTGGRTSNGKKIKKLVKIVKELMGEVANLVDLLIRFSNDHHNQKQSDQCDLT
ncbi:hypothetical protein PIB30_001412 [Stylosanthes scabra]|uniref:Uncharacterized protein n=1 Tax=Stylosanthes scabra TaxID=79078 RepID=A0ABU6YZY1_9FABA|nr:hypothetical protein [Stylosanthes scabra]